MDFSKSARNSAMASGVAGLFCRSRIVSRSESLCRGRVMVAPSMTVRVRWMRWSRLPIQSVVVTVPTWPLLLGNFPLIGQFGRVYHAGYDATINVPNFSVTLFLEQTFVRTVNAKSIAPSLVLKNVPGIVDAALPGNSCAHRQSLLHIICLLVGWHSCSCPAAPITKKVAVSLRPNDSLRSCKIRPFGSNQCGKDLAVAT